MEDKARVQLSEEVTQLRQRVAEVEALEVERKRDQGSIFAVWPPDRTAPGEVENGD